MKVLIIFFKLHLKFIYFFIKLFTKVDSNKILFLSRQSNHKSIDFELNNIVSRNGSHLWEGSIRSTDTYT